MDDLHCERADFDAGQPMDHSSISPGAVRVSSATHLLVPDDYIHLSDVDRFLSKLKTDNDAVMLSEAKHLCYLVMRSLSANDQRLFDSHRMTFVDGCKK